jgi:hypothetical protein
MPNPNTLPPFYYPGDIPLPVDFVKYFISHTIGETVIPCPSPASRFKTFQVFLI